MAARDSKRAFGADVRNAMGQPQVERKDADDFFHLTRTPLTCATPFRSVRTTPITGVISATPSNATHFSISTSAGSACRRSGFRKRSTRAFAVTRRSEEHTFELQSLMRIS